jgi:hypothetical protein
MKKVIISLIIFFPIVVFANLSPIVEEGNVGYIDTNGNVIIPCQYDGEVSYNKIKFGKRTIIDFTIPHWAEFQNNAVTLKIPHSYMLSKRYTYMLVNNENKPYFPEAEEQIYGLSENIAIQKFFYKNLQKVYDFDISYIRLDGQALTKSKYDFAAPFSNGLALARIKNDSNYVFIDKTGSERFTIADAKPFAEYLAAAEESGKWGYVDTNGNWIIKPTFAKAYSFIDGFARVSDGSYYGYIDKQGKSLTQIIYQYADDFSDGLALVKRNDRFSFIDKNAKQAIDATYILAQSFSDGIAPVYENGTFHFIQPDGTPAFDGNYDYALSFKNGLAKVWRNGEVDYINKKGEVVYVIIDADNYSELLKKIK